MGVEGGGDIPDEGPGIIGNAEGRSLATDQTIGDERREA